MNKKMLDGLRLFAEGLLDFSNLAEREMLATAPPKPVTVKVEMAPPPIIPTATQSNTAPPPAAPVIPTAAPAPEPPAQPESRPAPPNDFPTLRKMCNDLVRELYKAGKTEAIKRVNAECGGKASTVPDAMLRTMYDKLCAAGDLPF